MSNSQSRKTWLAGLSVLVALSATARAQSQLPNLTNTPTAVRFTLTDRVWAANPGEASICLWEDDKLAAFSITVDDNSATNIPWWLAQSAAIGFRLTWFVITGYIGDGNALHGTWAGYNDVLSQGHDVQSHSVNHTNSAAQYRDSQSQIQSNMPGHTCEFIAYPGGVPAGSPDRVSAAQYYSAARGTGGTINQVNKTDYLNINAMSSFNLTNAAWNWSYLPNLLTTNDMRWYRGWAVIIFHGVADTNTVTPLLAFMAANQTNLWIGRFGDVAKYGEERDTATLAVITNTTERIVLTLTDQMLDSRFNYPLTIKVRLPLAWTNITATQNSQSISTSVLEHNGGRYALVKAAPDCGPITLTPLVVDSDSDGIPDAWMLQYFGHTIGQSNDLSSAQQDADGDGMTNEQEFTAGTVPTNAASYFKVGAVNASGDDFVIRFATVTGKSYRVLCGDDLAAANGWTAIVADNVPGTGGETAVLDVGAAVLPRRFYRVKILP
jgi:hypothetical protein